LTLDPPLFRRNVQRQFYSHLKYISEDIKFPTQQQASKYVHVFGAVKTAVNGCHGLQENVCLQQPVLLHEGKGKGKLEFV